MPTPSSPNLHTPEELLAGAEVLLASSDQQLMRAAVLEALAALEWYVHQTVFPLLSQNFSASFTKWLEDKTKMNFEDRLSQLVPLATNTRINKNSPLWVRYQDSKQVRNRVAHSGQRITRAEAREAVGMVKDWLAFLGSTAEVDLSLLGLKKFLENNTVSIVNEREAIELVQRYYEKTSPAVGIEQEKVLATRRADMVLSYDTYNTLIEVKFSSLRNLRRSIEQVNSMANEANMIPGRNGYRPVIIFFTEESLPATYKTIQKVKNGISLVVIRIKKTDTR